MRTFSLAAIVVALCMPAATVLAQTKTAQTKATVGRKGMVAVVNETATPISVWLGEEKLGEILPGARREFTETPAGSFITTGSRLLMAQSAAEDRRWGPREILVSEEGSEWKVNESATTGVKITNYTKDALAVQIDAKPAGKVAAGGDALFMDLRKGMVKFSATSVSGKLSYSPRFIEVKEGAMAEWKIGNAPAAGAAEAKADGAK